MATPRLARALHSGMPGMEPLEYSRLEKALILAAFLPFLAIGLLALFA